VTSYSGLYNGRHGEAHSLLLTKTGNTETALARVFGKRPADRAVFRELMVTLIGAAAGGAASVNQPRVQSNADVNGNMQGGLRVIETKSLLNRVTTAADVTNIKNALQLSSQPTYATDLSGNGGGGKLGAV